MRCFPSGLSPAFLALPELFLKCLSAGCNDDVGVGSTLASHLGVSEIDQPVVRDRDPMRASGQMVQIVFGAAEGSERSRA